MYAGRHSSDQLRFALYLLLLSSGIYGEVLAQTNQHANPVVKTQGYIPFASAPIGYRTTALRDPIARLQARLDGGSESLPFDAQRGYLPGVLRALHVPGSSQALVFSKTSFQYLQISPKTPRALYFNDDVYVGRVHGAKFLEFISFDPVLGAIFYVLDERKSDYPVFERAAGDCVQCHVASSTHGVPGVMLRSVVTRTTGYPAAGTSSFLSGHESPIEQRWGGWYVTGLLSPGPAHMGNSVRPKAEHGEASPVLPEQILHSNTYLRYTSDAVALLVLAHQTQMHNLITKLAYVARLGSSPDQIQQAANDLVRYLFFEDEAPLDGLTAGDSPFARDFAAHGPRDPAGRSLRDFDLHHRIFKYPCSYLIYSDDFDALPQEPKDYIYDRLFEILTEAPGITSRLTTPERKAILEILVATKPDLPPSWMMYSTKRNKQAAPSTLNSASVGAVPFRNKH